MRHSFQSAALATGLLATLLPQVSIADCGPLPDNGKIGIFGRIQGPQSNSGFKFTSNLAKPAVVAIYDASLQEKLGLAVVYPNHFARMRFPPGEYGMRIFTGDQDKWCGSSEGFDEGQNIVVKNIMLVEDAAVTELTFSQSQLGLINIAMRYASVEDDFAEGLPQQEIDGKYLKLNKRPDGHYHVDGEINGVPLNFIVDTGATVVSVGQADADKYGIRNCIVSKFQTGNGDVEGCIGKADKIVFGKFSVRNVDVAVMPNMEGALLGMNVLSLVVIQQQGSAMYLGKR